MKLRFQLTIVILSCGVISLVVAACISYFSATDGLAGIQSQATGRALGIFASSLQYGGTICFKSTGDNLAIVECL